ncbi:MAG: ABC-2 transporter permease [Oscillospiraceae bacterium]|nr:ABC-2 transporter permease [Oscillospiraceae bacterium]
MLVKLLKKELALALHPVVFLMLGLSALILIPNYPYAVSFFYVTLGLYFISLGGRENGDVLFTLTLPVARADAVTGRFLLAGLIEAASLLLAGGMIALRGLLLKAPNAAGMDANLFLLGEGLVCFGVFHLIFFPAYYRHPDRIGVPFLLSGIALFGLITADVALSYALPFWRDVLDTPDPAHLGAKLVALAVCAAFYVLASALALVRSRKRFAALDVR